MENNDFIELEIDNNNNLVGLECLNNDQLSKLREEHCIFIYKNTKTKKSFEGLCTTNFLDRHKENFNESNQKFFSSSAFNKVIVVFTSFYENPNFSFEKYNELRSI